MSCEQGKCKDSNLENNHQDCSLIFKEIVNDEELKTLTEEDIKAIFIVGGGRLQAAYGVIRPD